ncbi:MAG: hypothetical protein ACLPUT_04530 [Solirubrobacteraceae bacterium]
MIKRNQEAMTGLLGGHKGMQFTLAYRLVLTPEEAQLVEQYKLGDYPVTWRTFQGQQVPGDTISSLVRGASQTLTDVTTLVENEGTIKSACDKLPPLFEVARTFGGEEVVEYPRS